MVRLHPLGHERLDAGKQDVRRRPAGGERVQDRHPSETHCLCIDVARERSAPGDGVIWKPIYPPAFGVRRLDFRDIKRSAYC